MTVGKANGLLVCIIRDYCNHPAVRIVQNVNGDRFGAKDIWTTDNLDHGFNIFRVASGELYNKLSKHTLLNSGEKMQLEILAMSPCKVLTFFYVCK